MFNIFQDIEGKSRLKRRSLEKYYKKNWDIWGHEKKTYLQRKFAEE